MRLPEHLSPLFIFSFKKKTRPGVVGTRQISFVFYSLRPIKQVILGILRQINRKEKGPHQIRSELLFYVPYNPLNTVKKLPARLEAHRTRS